MPEPWVGRTITDGFGVMKVLEATPDFEDVVPSSVGKAQSGDDSEIHYKMRYTPAATLKPPPPPAGPAPAAGPQAGVGP